VIPVSDQQTAAAAIGLAMQEFADHRTRVRDLVHQYRGDENKPVRDALLAEVYALDLLEQRMLSHLRQRAVEETPAGLPRRVPAEQTHPNLRRLRHNKGPA
jgi:hypothetical protein